VSGDLAHWPRALFERQVFGTSEVRAPVVNGALIAIDTPEQYMREWKIHLDALRNQNPELAGDQIDYRSNLVLCEWGIPRGGARQRIEFNWPINGGSFSVTGSQIRLFVTDNVVGGPIIAAAPIYGAFATPGTVQRNLKHGSGLRRSFLSVVNAGGTFAVGTGQPAPRNKFPPKATHVRIACVFVDPAAATTMLFEYRFNRVSDGVCFEFQNCAANANRNNAGSSPVNLVCPIPWGADLLEVKSNNLVNQSQISIDFLIEP